MLFPVLEVLVLRHRTHGLDDGNHGAGTEQQRPASPDGVLAGRNVGGLQQERLQRLGGEGFVVHHEAGGFRRQRHFGRVGTGVEFSGPGAGKAVGAVYFLKGEQSRLAVKFGMRCRGDLAPSQDQCHTPILTKRPYRDLVHTYFLISGTSRKRLGWGSGRRRRQIREWGFAGYP